MKIQFFFLFICILLSFPIKAQIGLGADPPEKKDIVRYVVLPGEKHQTLNNFSASEGWSMQFIGLWDDKKTNQIADWLFSTEKSFNFEFSPFRGMGGKNWQPYQTSDRDNSYVQVSDN